MPLLPQIRACHCENILIPRQGQFLYDVPKPPLESAYLARERKMGAKESPVEAGSVEHLPSQPRQNMISDELRRIMTMIQEVCPPEAVISFHFDEKLYVHIDVRNMEYVTGIEAILPKLGAGLFHDIRRGPTPHRPFLHRVSALVER